MSNQFTPLGLALRVLRDEQREKLFEMAKKTGVSSAYISAVERGNKKPSPGFVAAVAEAYRLNANQRRELEGAAAQSIQTHKIVASRPAQRETAALLARMMNTLSDDQLADIRRILGKEVKESER